MSRSAYAARRLAAAIHYMEGRLPENPTLDMVARAAFCSKFHFHRQFADAMGMTVHTYLQRRRLTEAARALVFSRMPILHIALEAGYESQQAFAGVFKAMYKKPPGAFRDAAAFYPLQLPAEIAEDCSRPENAAARLLVRPAAPGDIPGWMGLLRQVVDGFPCLDEGGHRQSLARAMAREEAFLCEDGGRTVGTMIISRETRMIDFMGAHPLYRDAGVREAMLGQALSLLPDVAITTFREGDKADTGHRKSLQHLGFIAAEPLVEFGYPTQKFILGHRRRKR